MKKSYQLSGGRFSLFRERDNRGDSGPSWSLFDADATIKSKQYQWVNDARPGEVRIGCGIRVGSLTARTYSAQDWWQCSGVSEILETSEVDENGEYEWIRFKTNKSTYKVEGF